MPVVSLQHQSYCVPSPFNRGDETNAEHSSHPAGSILYEGAQTDHPAEAYSDQPGTVWSNHNNCPAHTPTKRDGYVQLVWDLNGPLFGAPTTHPYRSTAPLIYNPRERPNASDAVPTTLDSSPRATVTFAQGTNTGGGNDRPHGDPWTSGLQPQTCSNDNSEREDYLHSPADGFSASSSPALARSADDPDSSSSGAPADLSASSDAAAELAKDATSDKEGLSADLVRPHVPPNINVGILQQSVLPGVRRVIDTHSALHRVQRSPPGSSGIAKPAKLKSILKKNLSLDSSISDADTDETTDLVIDEYLENFPLADISVSPTKDFSDIETLLDPNNLTITVAPSLLIPTQPKYFKVTPLPPYFINLRPTKEQKYPIQNVCTLGPGHHRTIETTVKVTERIIQRVATPGIKKSSDNPFTNPSTEPTVLTATYPSHPHFKLAVIDPILSFPCLTNQQVYPAEQAAQLMADNITITELGELNECETYRWDVIFTASLRRLDRLSLTTDTNSGNRYINLLTDDHIIRWQIVTPHDDATHAAHSPFTWNTHIYFAKADHPTYVQSYQLN